mmetsp:Transcript_5592/g.11772  ORF Transcript_5592/g.11772 Transcript_5592/m.11772 type:complete len:270 (-) Transcript_5592:421-1230(-)
MRAEVALVHAVDTPFAPPNVREEDRPGVHNCTLSSSVFCFVAMVMGVVLIVLTSNLMRSYNRAGASVITSDTFTTASAVALASGCASVLLGLTGFIVQLLHRGFPLWFLLLIVTFALQITAAVLTASLESNVTVVITLESWQDAVRDNPVSTCIIEDAFQCAGFHASDCAPCAGTPPSTCALDFVTRCPALNTPIDTNSTNSAEFELARPSCLKVENDPNSPGCEASLESRLASALYSLFALNLSAVIIGSVSLVAITAYRCVRCFVAT